MTLEILCGSGGRIRLTLSTLGVGAFALAGALGISFAFGIFGTGLSFGTFGTFEFRDNY